MKPDINDIHKFYECNVPDYQRKDILECNKFFLPMIGQGTKNLIKTVLHNFDRFKKFVAIEWMGYDEIKTASVFQIKEKQVDRCSCGGRMFIRRNSKDGSKFYGCSNYPKCKITKDYEKE